MSHLSPEAFVESLDLEGQGVARVEGKTIFIAGAITGERVTYDSYRKKPTWERARVAQVLDPSFMRVRPRCPHFGVCGGCTLQHIDAAAQVAAKQRALEDALAHIGRVRPETMLAPLHGPYFGYRHRARLAVRDVAKKGGVLVGFHERGSSFVADMRECHTMPRRISALLVPLRALVESLAIRTRVPQIEVACGDDVDVLVLRHLEPVSEADAGKLRAFADAHGIQWWLQPAGPDSARPFHPVDAPALCYRLPEFGVTLRFLPTDFTQVNVAMNRVLVRRAMRLLDPQAGERVGDFFSGLGNFTLPIARSGARVIGLEGSAALVARARDNARLNGLDAEFMEADLFRFSAGAYRALGPFDKLLIDPPRDGAIEVVKAIDAPLPSRIVYVSCNPATLARDAEVLVNVKGYRLAAAGVVNMFPQTGHAESIALFRASS